MARRGWESLQKGREELEGPPGRPGWVDRPSKRTGRGWEALLESWEGSGRKEEDGRPLQRAGKGHESLPESQEEFGSPPRGPAEVLRPFWRAGRVREALQVGQ